MTEIYIDNQSGEELPSEALEAVKLAVRSCVDREFPSHKFEINITFCTDSFILMLNREHRCKDSPTDVLSFPFYDFDSPDTLTLLGDIVISTERAKEQAEKYGHSYKRELCFLAVHSTLHLLGYDHEDVGQAEKEEMEKTQEAILEELGIIR